MKVEFKQSFLTDLEKVRHESILGKIREEIELAEKATNLQELHSIKKLRGGKGYYRIRIGDYHLGLVVEEATIIFIRCLHRKDIYRYFP